MACVVGAIATRGSITTVFTLYTSGMLALPDAVLGELHSQTQLVNLSRRTIRQTTSKRPTTYLGSATPGSYLGRTWPHR